MKNMGILMESVFRMKKKKVKILHQEYKEHERKTSN